MKYFIDNTEVEFEKYKEKIYGQIYSMVQADSISYVNGTNGGNSELADLFQKLSPIEKELAIIMITKRILEIHLSQESFDLRGFQFRREESI